MATRKHAAEAEHQIQAGGSQRKDQDAGGEADVELLAESTEYRRQGERGQQKHDGERFLIGSWAVESHQARAGKRPCGLKKRMPAISSSTQIRPGMTPAANSLPMFVSVTMP